MVKDLLKVLSEEELSPVILDHISGDGSRTIFGVSAKCLENGCNFTAENTLITDCKSRVVLSPLVKVCQTHHVNMRDTYGVGHPAYELDTNTRTGRLSIGSLAFAGFLTQKKPKLPK